MSEQKRVIVGDGGGTGGKKHRRRRPRDYREQDGYKVSCQILKQVNREKQWEFNHGIWSKIIENKW